MFVGFLETHTLLKMLKAEDASQQQPSKYHLVASNQGKPFMANLEVKLDQLPLDATFASSNGVNTQTASLGQCKAWCVDAPTVVRCILLH